MNMGDVTGQMHVFNMHVVTNKVHEMEEMIEKYRYNVNNVNHIGTTALHKAAWYSSPTTLEFILSKVAIADPLNNKGESPLMIAAERGRLDMFLMIINKLQESINPIRLLSNTHVNREGKTLLMIACSQPSTPLGGAFRITKSMKMIDQKSSNLVQWLLCEGFDPYSKDHEGRTALHHAVQSGRLDVNETVLKLLESRPKNTLVHMEDKGGNTALHLACTKKNGSTAVVSILLAHGARTSDINFKLETPLHTSARSGVAEVVPLLLEAAADTQARDILGRTPTHAAVEKRHDKDGIISNPDTSVLQSLMDTWDHRKTLSHLSIKDNNGMTPLLLACDQQSLFDVVRLFFVPDINLNAADINGYTVLHICVRHGWFIEVEMLIELGVEIHVSDKNGERPIELATRLRKRLEMQKRSTWKFLKCEEMLLARENISQKRWGAISMGLHKRLGDRSKIGALNIREIEHMIAKIL
jgi:ankyrin repeat protein